MNKNGIRTINIIIIEYKYNFYKVKNLDYKYAKGGKPFGFDLSSYVFLITLLRTQIWVQHHIINMWVKVQS